MIFGFEMAFITFGVLAVIGLTVYLLHDMGKKHDDDDDNEGVPY